jgi:hypothetical protein
MGKVRVKARVPLPSLFDLPQKTPRPSPEAAADLLPLLERLLLAAEIEPGMQASETRRSGHD